MRPKKIHDFNQGTTNSTINSTLLETCTKSTEDLQKRNISFRIRVMPLLVQTSKITTLKHIAHGRPKKILRIHSRNKKKLKKSTLLKTCKKSTEDLSKINISFQSRIMLSLVQTSKIITQMHKAHETKKISRLQSRNNKEYNSTFKKLCTKSTGDLQKGKISFQSRIMPSLVQTSKITTLKHIAHGRPKKNLRIHPRNKKVEKFDITQNL